MMIRLMACGLLLSALSFHSMADAQSAPVDFDEFRALQGWVFSADLTKADGLVDLHGAPATAADGVAFDAGSFDPATFDARDYVIALDADPTMPTQYRIGDRGVLQFHSADRCHVLFDRHLLNLAKPH